MADFSFPGQIASAASKRLGEIRAEGREERALSLKERLGEAGIRQRSRALDLQERGLGIQESNVELGRMRLDFNQRKQSAELARETIGVISETLIETVEKGGRERAREMLEEGSLSIVAGQAQQRLNEALGENAPDLMARFNTLIDLTRSPEEAAAAEVSAAEAQAAQIVSIENPEIREGLMRRFNMAAPQAREFMTLLDELEKEQDPARREMITQRLNKLLTPETGISFFTDPSTGAMMFTTQGGAAASLLSGMTAQQQTTQIATSQAIQNTLNNIDAILAETERNPEAFGAAGTIRRGAEATAGAVGSALEALGIDVGPALEGLTSALGIEPPEFDPQLSRTQTLENDLATDLAKLRMLIRGERGTRAFDRAFQAARDEVQLTGMFGAEQVKNRLRAIRQLFEAELQNLQQRNFPESTMMPQAPIRDVPTAPLPPAPVPNVPVAPMPSPASTAGASRETQRILDAARGILGRR